MTTVPQVQITARDYYVLKKGIPLGAAIALVSVLYYESHLNPGSQGYQTTETPGVLNPHGAYGIASWNGPRQQTLLDFATAHSLKAEVLETQLAFVLTEIGNNYPNCWSAIRSTASYQGVINVLVDEYEDPKNKSAEINGALTIAKALAALPPPQAAQPMPLPKAPATQVPIPVTPPPAVSAGLPPISGMEAGMDAALRDYMGSARDALVNQRAAIDKRIAWIDASIGEFEKLNPALTTQLLLSPILPPSAAEPAVTPSQPQGTTMPTLAINWKTTLSGIVMAAGALSTQFPELAPYANVIMAIGSLALGFVAKDASVTGGTKSAVTGASVENPVSLIAK